MLSLRFAWHIPTEHHCHAAEDVALVIGQSSYFAHSIHSHLRQAGIGTIHRLRAASQDEKFAGNSKDVDYPYVLSKYTDVYAMRVCHQRCPINIRTASPWKEPI